MKIEGKHRNVTSVERIAAKEELGRSARKLAMVDLKMVHRVGGLATIH